MVIIIKVIMAYLLARVCLKEKEASIMVCLLAWADPAAGVSTQALATPRALAWAFELHLSFYFLLHSSRCTA